METDADCTYELMMLIPAYTLETSEISKIDRVIRFDLLLYIETPTHNFISKNNAPDPEVDPEATDSIEKRFAGTWSIQI